MCISYCLKWEKIGILTSLGFKAQSNTVSNSFRSDNVQAKCLTGLLRNINLYTPPSVTNCVTVKFPKMFQHAKLRKDQDYANIQELYWDSVD